MDVDLAVLLFGITLVVEVVGWIGSDALANLFYSPISRFSSNPAAKSQKTLRSEILKLRAELAATSSVDEFSKWARIRRRLDKAVADLESVNTDASSSRKAFASIFKRLLWILTTILPFVVTSWHRKAAVFYLPPGWFGPASWWMGLPSAPAGGIACGVWTMACKRTIGAVKDAVVELASKDPVVVSQAAPVAVPAQSVSGQEKERPAGAGAKKAKDEL